MHKGHTLGNLVATISWTYKLGVTCSLRHAGFVSCHKSLTPIGVLNTPQEEEVQDQLTELLERTLVAPPHEKRVQLVLQTDADIWGGSLSKKANLLHIRASELRADLDMSGEDFRVLSSHDLAEADIDVCYSVVLGLQDSNKFFVALRNNSNETTWRMGQWGAPYMRSFAVAVTIMVSNLHDDIHPMVLNALVDAFTQFPIIIAGYRAQHQLL